MTPKRALLALVAALALAVIAALAYAPALNRLPELARCASPVPDAAYRLDIPAIRELVADRAAGNDLCAVFVAPAVPSGTAVTLVFRDEDHPFWAADRLYDVARRFLYGRVADVETLVVTADEVILPGVFAGDQPFDATLPRHHSTRIPRASLPATVHGRPLVLTAATWNHMLALDAPAAPWQLARPPVFAGSREDVERIFADPRSYGR